MELTDGQRNLLIAMLSHDARTHRPKDTVAQVTELLQGQVLQIRAKDTDKPERNALIMIRMQEEEQEV